MDTTQRTRIIDRPRRWCVMLTINTYRRHRLLCHLGATGIEPLPIGLAVVAAWARIPRHRPWVAIGEHVIMPDHFHGILRCGFPPPGRNGSIRHIVSGFKAEATRLARASGALGRSERLWHLSYYVGFPDTPEAAARAGRYIRNNPSVAIRVARARRRYPAR